MRVVCIYIYTHYIFLVACQVDKVKGGSIKSWLVTVSRRRQEGVKLFTRRAERYGLRVSMSFLWGVTRVLDIERHENI